jgi:probable HAF family extracellular repeat protein
MAALYGDAEPVTDIAPRYTVTDLGILPGFESSRATALNDRGQVIGSLSHEEMDFDPHGFVWADGIMRDLGKVWLEGINNKGQCVGTRHPKHRTVYAALYTAGRFQELLKNTSASSMAYNINDSGQVVGLSQVTNLKAPASTKRGCFLWENGKRRYLDIPEGYSAGDAVAINNNGQIAGEVWNGGSNERHACLWIGGDCIIFDEPDGFNQSRAIAVNNSGQVLLRAFQSNFKHLLELLSENEQEWNSTDPESYQILFNLCQEKIAALPKDVPVFRQQAFLWQGGEVQAVEGLAEAVNDSGQVVGWSGCIPDANDLAKGREAPYAFFWQNGELLDLNDLLQPESGWRLTKANAINNRGQIVGHGEIDGKTRAFLLTPIIP